MAVLALALATFADDAGKAVDLRVEIVDMMEGDGLQAHGQLGTSILVGSLVADDEMLQANGGFAGQFGMSRQKFIEYFDTLHLVQFDM